MKTVKNDASVIDFLESVEDPRKKEDAYTILQLMKEVTGEVPCMWGTSIIGFGSHQYVYASGRTGEWMLIGFSPRKQNISIYIMDGFEKHQDLLAKLGKHKTSKACLYIKRLEQVDELVLKQIMENSVASVKEEHQ